MSARKLLFFDRFLTKSSRSIMAFTTLLLVSCLAASFHSCCAVSLPELYLNTPQLVEYWGYSAETHQTTTDDGYILTLHRMFNKTAQAKYDGPRPVFYLQHGFVGSSTMWVINLPYQSLGFMLADQGYDVWMGNIRGNCYSRHHIEVDPQYKAFWDFSIDDHAKIDLPTMVDYILESTGQKQLYYIGASQGTIMAFAGFSESLELQSKIRMYFAVAPITRMVNVNENFKNLAWWGTSIERVCRLFGKYEMMAGSKHQKKFMAFLCKWLPFACKYFGKIMNGPKSEPSKFFNTTRAPVYFTHIPCGTSLKNMMQYSQMINTGRFQKYDYGKRENIKRYNAPIPPEYNVTRVNIPTVLVSGSVDGLAVPKDVEWTMKQLPNLVNHIEVEGYGHTDFMWAINAGTAVNEKIIKIVEDTEKYY